MHKNKCFIRGDVATLDSGLGIVSNDLIPYKWVGDTFFIFWNWCWEPADPVYFVMVATTIHRRREMVR